MNDSVCVGLLVVLHEFFGIALAPALEVKWIDRVHARPKCLERSFVDRDIDSLASGELKVIFALRTDALRLL